MQYLEGLNAEQKEAALHTNGPLLILAGAGAGKTKTITHRIAHLIASGVPGDAILAVTFTNKAAREMKERVESLLKTLPHEGGEAHTSGWPTIATFHSLCVRILREHAPLLNLPRSFSIWDRDDQTKAVKEALKFLDAGDQYEPRSILSRISRAKGDAKTQEDYAREANNPFAHMVTQAWARYEETKRKDKALDFDDLLLATLTLLRGDSRTLSKLQARWTHLTVDEYQDTNRVQFELMQLLAGEKRNVCVVGDVDQCVAEGTSITMGDRTEKPIQQVRAGDYVLASYGNGDMRPARVTRVRKRKARDIVRVTTTHGTCIETSLDHTHFAGYVLAASPQTYFTYLMHKQGIGWRIGVSQMYTRGQKKPVPGFILRANHEHADAVWIIATHPSAQEARIAEYTLSLSYGVPTLPFVARKGGSTHGYVHDQDALRRIFASVASERGALKLLSDFSLSQNAPHHRTQGRPHRTNVVVTLCGDRRGATSMHRISVVGDDKERRDTLVSLGLSVRAARKGSSSWRFETCSKDYPAILEIARSIVEAIPGASIVSSARVVRNAARGGKASLPLTAACALRPGMMLCTTDGSLEAIATVEVVRKTGVMYDLDVANVHNFLANGILTHNCIYGWRGADIEHLLSFERVFPGAKVVILERNYRSTQTILTAAHDIIKKNTKRYDKKLYTENNEGEPIALYSAMSEQDEARYVGDTIRLLAAEGVPLSEVAILYRANFQSRALEQALLEKNVPHRVLGTRFFDRKEVKDVLSYLKASLNPESRTDIARIVACPPRGIGKGTLAHMLEGTLDELSSAARKKVGDFYALLEEVRGAAEHLPASEVVRLTIEKSGLAAQYTKGTEEDLERLGNMKELASLATKYDASPAPSGIEQLLEEAALLGEQDNVDKTMNAVSLMTVHASKGLEFDVVFVTGLEEGLFPMERRGEGDDDEEERRLFYVALTRARKKVILTHAGTRLVYGSRDITMPSQFLSDIDSSLMMHAARSLLEPWPEDTIS